MINTKPIEVYDEDHSRYLVYKVWYNGITRVYSRIYGRMSDPKLLRNRIWHQIFPWVFK